MKKIYSLVVVTSVLNLCHVNVGKAQVYFADDNLKAAVEAVLGPDPTPADMQTLIHFGCVNKRVVDLTGGPVS